MNTTELERILKSGKKVNVLNYPVGIDIYVQNPYRICNISPNGDWKDSGTKLRAGFNRFLAFSKINKIEKKPVGNDVDFLLSSSMKDEYTKIKSNIEKANAKIVWKIFWLNHIEHDYETLPRDVNLIETSNMSKHSQAILFHFLAIEESLNFLGNPAHKINAHYWEKALSAWEATLNDDSFWQELDEIISIEKANGNFEFRNYALDSIKEELPSAILHTLSFIPLKYIEHAQNISNSASNGNVNVIPVFLQLILKSKLGSESLRAEYAKELVATLISRKITSELKTESLLKFADVGNYRKLFDNAMHFIDRIKEETLHLKKNISKLYPSDVSLIQDFDRIPDIHERSVEPLLEAIKSFAIMERENVDREIIDKTFFTQLTLSLRVLCELNISPSSRSVLIKNVFDLNSRFAYKRIDQKKLIELNIEKKALKQIVNNDLFEKFYLLQFCYFINGEFADPDASLYKTYKTTKGIVVTTTRTFIPRSKLAKDFHDSKIDLTVVKKRMQNNNEELELKEKQKRLKKELQTSKQQQQQIETLLSAFGKEEEKINAKYKSQHDQIAKKIQGEVEVLKTNPTFLKKLEPIEIEKKRLEEEKNTAIEKYGLKKKKDIALKQTILGSLLVVAGLSYFTTSLLFFHFHGVIGLGVFGVVGLFFIGNADRIRNKIEELRDTANQEIKQIDIQISIENDKIDSLTNELHPIAKSKFQKEIDELNKIQSAETTELIEKYDADQQKKNLIHTTSKIENAENETQGITKILQNYTVVKKLSEANNHPLEKIING